MSGAVDDAGQALVIAVLGIGIAAAAIVGLREAQERVLADAHSRRAGEAAVEAAGAVLADAQVALLSGLRDDRGLHRVVARRADITALVADPAVAAAALGAAQELATLNRAGPPTDLVIRDAGAALEVTLTLDRRPQRVSIGAACCRP